MQEISTLASLVGLQISPASAGLPMVEFLKVFAAKPTLPHDRTKVRPPSGVRW